MRLGGEKAFSDMGVEAVRRVNGRGGLAPHLSLRFDGHLFSVDTSRFPKSALQPDAYLITHAHSDHYGKSAMLSSRAVASAETAAALEIRHGRPYLGRTFQVGETIEVSGVEVHTIPTRHTIGSCAFFWENTQGTRILVTGDVKDYRNLPRCDLLVSEANYGDPWDSSCVFDDDLGSFWEALDSGAAFGAYAFGKAQRAVSLIRGMGYGGEIGMDRESLALTEALLPSCGPLVDFRDAPGTSVVTPPHLRSVRCRDRFMLTGRTDQIYRNIRLSDHLDFRGLMRMFDHLKPDGAIAYHPEGSRSRLLAHHLRQIGLEAVSVDQIEQTVP